MPVVLPHDPQQPLGVRADGEPGGVQAHPAVGVPQQAVRHGVGQPAGLRGGQPGEDATHLRARMN